MKFSTIKNLGMVYPKNLYDLHNMYFFLSLMKMQDKKDLLDCFNDDAVDTYKSILDIDEEFVDDGEYFIAPITYTNDNIIRESLLESIKEESKGKKVILFIGCDNPSPIFHEFTKEWIVIRSSGFVTDNIYGNTYGCPTFAKDRFRGKYLNKNLSLSFCGHYDTFPLRERIVNSLIKYSYTDFILRDVWANITELKTTWVYSHQKTPSEQSSKDFIDNLERNLYGLCVRGRGNFSFRLGETFMMGRIPVLIYTNCLLPFEHLIPYRKNTVFVTRENSNNFEDIDSVIQEFHNSHTEEELIQIQKENRQIWIDYFTVQNAFYKTKELIYK